MRNWKGFLSVKTSQNCSPTARPSESTLTRVSASSLRLQGCMPLILSETLTDDVERSAWSWKPENTGTDTIAAQDKPIYPQKRGRRHSFPPPSSYSPTNAPRWSLSLPQKSYTCIVPFENELELSRFARFLPDGDQFEPPKRNGEERHDFTPREGWERWPIHRRMSGSFESLVADAEKARSPAFIAPYRAPRESVLAHASLR